MPFLYHHHPPCFHQESLFHQPNSGLKTVNKCNTLSLLYIFIRLQLHCKTLSTFFILLSSHPHEPCNLHRIYSKLCTFQIASPSIQLFLWNAWLIFDSSQFHFQLTHPYYQICVLHRVIDNYMKCYQWQNKFLQFNLGST